MRTSFVTFAALALAATPLAAQDVPAAGTPHRQVLSFQPLSAIFTVYAAEYERVVGSSATVGVGATYWGEDDEDVLDVSYISTDLKLRYYPSGSPLSGFSFGGSVGYTRVAEEGEFGKTNGVRGVTIGTMIEYGWLLNANRSFYIGLGIGAKALFIDEDELDEDITPRYPTARFSIGWAF